MHKLFAMLIAGPAFLSPAGAQPRANARAQDTNGNGTIEPSEAQGPLKAQFALYDADGNGVLSGAEVMHGPLKFVSAPDITYTDRININLGGKRVEIVYM